MDIGVPALDPIQVILAIVSIYAASLTTYTIVQGQRAKKPKVRVTVGLDIISLGPGHADPALTVTAANIGERNLTLSSKSFLLPDNRRMHILEGWERDHEFPHVLTPGNSCMVWRNAREVARSMKTNGYNGIVQMIGTYGDALGNKYESSPFPFNVEEWSREDGET